jgi:hypothetical protein
MKTSVWLSYDLGVRGDYPGLYQWLDNLGAVECGNNNAFFKIDVEDEDVIEKLKSEIRENVDIKNGERFYVIYKRKEDGTCVGKYIFGNRKANPWTGYKQEPAKEDM